MNMKRTWSVVMMCVAGLLCSSCSVRRYIPDGEYLVNKVSITEDRKAPRKERISSGDMETYIRQTPNKRLLGTNFYVWLYTKANPEKHNGWNNWKRRVGEEPVLINEKLTRQSIRNLKIYMDSRGFFSSEAVCRIDTNYRRRRVNLDYRLHQGQPYRISSIDYEFRDEALKEIILPDTVNTLLKRGAPFDTKVLNEERERIAEKLNRLGYFNFSVNNIEYEADTLGGNQQVGVKMIVKQFLLGYDDQGNPHMENNAVYRIRNINIYPDFDPTVARIDDMKTNQLDTVNYQGLNIIYNNRLNLRPLVLRRTVPLYPNTMYNSATVARAYSDLMSLGYFRTAHISFREEQNPYAEPNFLSYVGHDADTARRLVREGYLSCNIICSPTLKQSFKIDLEGSTTSSFYGLKTTVGYQNRNIFRGAESFDVSVSMGYEFMKMRETKKKRATEYGVTLGLTFPRFLLPWRMPNLRTILQPKSKVELSVNVQDRSFYHRTLTSAGLTYMWQNLHYTSFLLRPIDINVVDVSYLDPDFLSHTTNLYLINSYKTQLMAGLSFSMTYNNQLKNKGLNATMIRLNGETAGNFVGALAHLFTHPTYEPNDTYHKIFDIRYSQYFRFDLSMARKIMLGDKCALAGRLYGGMAMAYGNSTSVPFDRLFYAGGSNSMRGWAPRALGPGSAPITDTEFPTQLGDIKLEANLEFRFPIWSILQGATFFDLGNIWFLHSNPDQYSNDAVFYLKKFYKQLAFNTGLGLRFDIKFAVLRLDWGVQLYNPNMPAGERWIRKLRWKNTALNFGVGYPF